MENYWDPVQRRRVYPIDAPPGATQRERDQFRQNSKRNARIAAGRCPYCGRYPEQGQTRCARCLDLQRKHGALMRERQRAKREAERRAAAPRRCPRCGGSDLKQREIRNDRAYFKCRTCGRNSFGDGPPAPPPNYPCPYCGGRCVKRGRALNVRRKPQLYLCRSCGRCNTNLWPEDTPSPGGPFPHRIQFGLDDRAARALLVYCQEKKRSIAQAIREIFIHAAKVPPAHASAGHGGYTFQSPTIRAYLAAKNASPAPVLPTIPPGEQRLPSACPAAMEKQKRFRVGNRFTPSVLVTLRVSMRLNDLALASLLEIMRRRGLNHQDAARALIAETQQVARNPIRAAPLRNDLDDGW